MSTPTVGRSAPAFTLLDQNEEKVRLSALKGRKVLVYFYPRADTPGCTTQACGLRDIAAEIGDTVIIGISPDKPAKLKKFDDKYELGFTLVSDLDHAIAEKYAVWVEKKNYGKSHMGIARTTFLIDPEGRIAHVWTKVKPEGHAAVVLETLRTTIANG